MTNKYHSVKPIKGFGEKRLFIETYGCQMNVNDSEVVLSILQPAGYTLCESIKEADLILINTCSIRDNAEQRIWGRLDLFRIEKTKRKGVKVGILGCMAERLKEDLLNHPAVDLVAGPDSYRSLPFLLESLDGGDKQINTMLLRRRPMPTSHLSEWTKTEYPPLFLL
jgi:tRNA-i(6)A37 thiotransferase enzyme MiaB